MFSLIKHLPVRKTILARLEYDDRLQQLHITYLEGRRKQAELYLTFKMIKVMTPFVSILFSTYAFAIIQQGPTVELWIFRVSILSLRSTYHLLDFAKTWIILSNNYLKLNQFICAKKKQLNYLSLKSVYIYLNCVNLKLKKNLHICFELQILR